MRNIVVDIKRSLQVFKWKWRGFVPLAQFTPSLVLLVRFALESGCSLHKSLSVIDHFHFLFTCLLNYVKVYCKENIDTNH